MSVSFSFSCQDAIFFFATQTVLLALVMRCKIFQFNTVFTNVSLLLLEVLSTDKWSSKVFTRSRQDWSKYPPAVARGRQQRPPPDQWLEVIQPNDFGSSRFSQLCQPIVVEKQLDYGQLPNRERRHSVMSVKSHRVWMRRPLCFLGGLWETACAELNGPMQQQRWAARILNSSNASASLPLPKKQPRRLGTDCNLISTSPFWKFLQFIILNFNFYFWKSPPENSLQKIPRLRARETESSRSGQLHGHFIPYLI